MPVIAPTPSRSSTTRYKPIIQTYPTLNEAEEHPYFDWRRPIDEDDNIPAAKEIKRQNRRNKIHHFIKRHLSFTNPDPKQPHPSNIPAPEVRPFNWMISS